MLTYICIFLFRNYHRIQLNSAWLCHVSNLHRSQHQLATQHFDEPPGAGPSGTTGTGTGSTSSGAGSSVTGGPPANPEKDKQPPIVLRKKKENLVNFVSSRIIRFLD